MIKDNPIKRFDFRISENFWASDVLAPEYFMNYPNQLAQFLTPFLLVVPQQLRDHFGKPIIINTWMAGGDLRNRGKRTWNCLVGGKESFHKMGLAIDINVQGLTQEEVLQEVLKRYFKFPLIRAYEKLEFTKGWNHFDGRNNGKETLIAVEPL